MKLEDENMPNIDHLMYLLFLIVSMHGFICIWLYCSLEKNLTKAQAISKSSEQPFVQPLDVQPLDVLHVEDFQDQSETHFVYTVGCGGKSSYKYQFIQCLTLENSFFLKQRYGTLTRIVTGCTTDYEIQTYLNRTVSIAPKDLTRFEVLFTETSEKLSSGKIYVMFNRPNGLIRYFHGKLKSRFVNLARNDVFIVLDPDFIFLRNFPTEYLDVDDLSGYAGYYHMGSSWMQWGKEICKQSSIENWKYFSNEKLKNLITTENCNMFDKIKRSKELTYQGGAPYVMRRKTWLALLPTWMLFFPIVQEKFYDSIETDMFAWIFASIFLGIKQNIKRDLMRTCMWPESHQDILTDDYFLHYCQRYHVFEKTFKVNVAKEFVGSKELSHARDYKHTFSFSKYWMQARGKQLWITDCQSPVLMEMPNTVYAPTNRMKNHLKAIDIIIKATNDALTKFKYIYCPKTSKINVKKRVILHEAHKINDHRLNSIIS